MTPFLQHSRNDEIVENGDRDSACQGLGWGRVCVDCGCKDRLWKPEMGLP